MEFFVKATKRELTTKKLEAYQRWAELRQWGLKNPIKFSEYIFGIEFLDFQKNILMNSWIKRYVLWAVTRNGGKSFLQAPLVMSKQILIPNFTTYFLSGSHEQSINTIKKIEDVAKKNITSLTGLTDVFMNELVKSQANTEGDTTWIWQAPYVVTFTTCTTGSSRYCITYSVDT